MRALLFFVSVIFVTTIGCKKKPSEDYVSKMGGTRVWRVFDSGAKYPNATVSRTYSETFAVTVVNWTTIKVKGVNLFLQSKDVQNGVMVFGYSAPTIFSYQLTYYYNADSMHYRSGNFGSSSWNTLDYYTP